MSAFRVYTASLVPYKDLNTEGLRLRIVESGYINCATSYPEVSNYVKKWKIVTRSTFFLEKNGVLAAQMLLVLVVLTD